MIHRVYIHIIAPLTIYLGRSFPRYVRSLSVAYRIFLPFFTELVLVKVLGCVRSNNFESSPDRPSFVIRFYYPLQKYKESDAQKLLCLIYSAKRSWPLHHSKLKFSIQDLFTRVVRQQMTGKKKTNSASGGKVKVVSKESHETRHVAEERINRQKSTRFGTARAVEIWMYSHCQPLETWI